jgi:hypothetical protein
MDAESGRSKYAGVGQTPLSIRIIDPSSSVLNMDVVRALRQDGIDAVDGDATRPETLEAAGVARAASLTL